MSGAFISCFAHEPTLEMAILGAPIIISLVSIITYLPINDDCIPTNGEAFTIVIKFISLLALAECFIKQLHVQRCMALQTNHSICLSECNLTAKDICADITCQVCSLAALQTFQCTFTCYAQIEGF